MRKIGKEREKMRKILLISLFLTQIALGNSMGLKFGLVAPQEYPPGVGLGGYALMKMSQNFYFYPNLNFWFSSDHHNHYYYNGHYTDYSDFSVRAMSFNVDFAVMFPNRPVTPYMGLGLAPVVAWSSWGDYPYDDHYNEVEPGINLFGGLTFPAGRQSMLLEFRGQFANHYSSFSICLGLGFKS